jgi:hypothetical protein
MLVHEARIQSRSNRFRVLAVVYLVLTIAAPVVLDLLESGFARRFGPGIWAACVEASLPLFTVVFAWTISGDAILRERDENSFLVVSQGVGTNAAYLATRWMAVTVIVLGMSLAPLLVTIAIGTRGEAGAATAGFAWVQWCVSVAPLVAMTTALSIGVSTIVGSTVGGTLVALFGGMVCLSILQGLLARFGRLMDGALEWLRLERPFEMVQVFLYRWSPRKPIYTDTSFDWRIYLELAIPRALVIVCLSLFALVASVAFIRRTRPNHRVWRIRENHPVRTYLGALRSLYEKLTPDGGLRVAERTAIALATLLALLSFVAILGMDDEWRRLAETRATVERGSWPEPGRPDFVVEKVTITGDVDPIEGLDTEVVMSMLNRGAEPVTRLAAELNPALEISASEASGLTVEKRWNRVEVRLPGPVDAGARIDVPLHIRGVPSDFEFAGYGEGDFATWFEGVKAARVELYIPDFSRSIRARHISVGRVDLKGSSLLPVPRVMPWEGEDQSVQLAGIEIEITSPEGLMLATSCGDLSEVHDGVERLRGRCRGEMRSFSIVGADWVVSGTGADSSLACLPGHREQGEKKARALVDAFAEARERWPDLAEHTRLIIAEVPNRQGFEAAKWTVAGTDLDLEPAIGGSIVKVSEDWMMSRKDLSPGQLMVPLRAQALLARRSVDPKQMYFFRHFYGTLAAAELGYSRENGAVLGQTERINHGLLENDPWESIWTHRLPAVVEGLRHRVGTKVLMDGVEELVGATGSAPASARELFRVLERRSGQSLDRFFDDFVAGGKLPKLQLADVTFVRQGATWVVEGVVENSGSGQAICEVVLRTEVAAMLVEVEADGGERSEFRFETRHRPVKVELDPDRKCFRWEPKTTRREVVNEAGRV